MKTPKPIVVKSVSGAVAASILVSSCLPGYDFDDSYYGPHADNLTHVLNLVRVICPKSFFTN